MEVHWDLRNSVIQVLCPFKINPDIFETAYIFPVQTKQVYPLIKPHRFQKCPIISYKVLKFLLTFVTPL